jgi:hypothetical protein
MDSNDYLQLNVILLYFVLFVFGVYNFKKLGINSKLLCCFVLFLSITESISFASLKTMGNNLIFYHLLPYFHQGFISVIYFKFTNNSRPQQQFIVISTFAFFMFAVCNSLFFQSFNQLPLFTILIQFLLILVFSILHYSNLLSQSTFSPLKYSSSFWFNTGNVVFYTFLIYWWIVIVLFCETNSNPNDIFLFVWLSNILLCICYFIALKTGIRKHQIHFNYPEYGFI